FIFIGLISLFFKSSLTPSGFRFKISIWRTVFGIAILWLSLFYGPWQISDRLDEKVSIGVSFVRYFLCPIL
ncbi:MAG: hypothetical protein NC818_07490, partial [Candidatus Omnitrophica bacterium]|nr:hypothetical protein [Candidatus Omnitrophota bacterium]